jgi:hypothetical protein
MTTFRIHSGNSSLESSVNLNSTKISFDTVSSLKLNAIDINQVLHTTSTGLSKGGEISKHSIDMTKFNITKGFGYIVNGHTDVEVPISTRVEWDDIEATAKYLATNHATYIGIDILGDLVQRSVRFTDTERRDIIQLGLVVHPDNTEIFIVNNEPTLNVELGAQVQDILSILGFRSISGNRILPSSSATTMQLKKDAGVLFKAGANFENETTRPHSFDSAGISTVQFKYRSHSGREDPYTNTIIPTIWDNTLETNPTVFPSIPATATLASVQQVYIFRNNEIRIQPGQKYYNNLTESIIGINSTYFITEENIENNGLYLGSICMIYGATDLNNSQQVIFVPSQGTTTNGSTTIPPLGYVAEDESNKQMTLIPDPSGNKYPSISAFHAQEYIDSTGTLPNDNIGKHIFFNPTGANIYITINSSLSNNYIIYFINESSNYTVTFSPEVGSNVTFGNVTEIPANGSGYLIRKVNTDKFYVTIYT